MAHWFKKIAKEKPRAASLIRGDMKAETRFGEEGRSAAKDSKVFDALLGPLAAGQIGADERLREMVEYRLRHEYRKAGQGDGGS